MLSSPASSASLRFVSELDGISRCARYAFGPNRLHMCGPDQNREVLAYIHEKQSDQGLSKILGGFATMYPYLRNIAEANKIRDPFDARVVEAYWLGNDLLDRIEQKTFFRHLMDDMQFRLKLDWRSREQLTGKIIQGARMHHSFHVFNIWQRTGHTGTQHDLYSLDQCRISWGQIREIKGPKLEVERQPLIIENNKLQIGTAENVAIIRELETNSVIDDVQVGDTISMHWGVPCEIIDKQQLANLKKYTSWSLQLTNQTI